MSTRRFYRPELDVLRLVAFLLVFFDHGSTAFRTRRAEEWGDALRVGLPLFFMLSAYLISELLVREHEATGTVNIRSFFVRRILRIWPLYFLFLAFVYVAGRFGHGYFPTAALVSFVALAGNWYTYYKGFLSFAVGIVWSISVEEQFYLLWPWLVRAGTDRFLRGSAIVLPLIAAVTLIYSGLRGIAPNRVWVNSFVQFGFFGIGAGLTVCLRHHSPKLTVLGRSVCLLGFLCCFRLLLSTYPVVRHLELISWQGLLAGYGLMALASVLLFTGFYGLQVSPQSPLVYLGRISYGLYVFHLLCLQTCEALLRHVSMSGRVQPFVHLTTGLGLTIVMAMLSHRWIEAPFINMKRRFTIVHSRDA